MQTYTYTNRLRSTILKQTSRTTLTPKYSSISSSALWSRKAQFSSQQVRMSSNKEWLAYIPDHPNSLSKRLEVRPKHLENIKPLIADRRVLMGGASLSKHPEEGESPDMTGSFMLITAESEEQVREMITNDVYTKGGVWNVDAMQIWPFKSAVRSAL